MPDHKVQAAKVTQKLQWCEIHHILHCSFKLPNLLTVLANHLQHYCWWRITPRYTVVILGYPIQTTKVSC